MRIGQQARWRVAVRLLIVYWLNIGLAGSDSYGRCTHCEQMGLPHPDDTCLSCPSCGGEREERKDTRRYLMEAFACGSEKEEAQIDLIGMQRGVECYGTFLSLIASYNRCDLGT